MLSYSIKYTKQCERTDGCAKFSRDLELDGREPDEARGTLSCSWVLVCVNPFKDHKAISWTHKNTGAKTGGSRGGCAHTCTGGAIIMRCLV